MTPLPFRIDPLPPIPAGLPGDPITGNTGGSSGGGQAGTSLQLSYYLYDHLGNTRMVFHTVLKAGEEDPTYVPEYLADYYPYGKILREWLNCTGERYLTTQHERDIETGYDYRGARFYDSDLGRFLSIDPLAAEYAGWSGYHYVLGNPVRLVDPDGRSANDIVIRPVRNDETNYKERTLRQLQTLTDDVLGYASDGKTVRIIEQRSGDKAEGTGLIRDLIGSPKVVEITNDTKGVTVDGKLLNLEKNAYAVADNAITASNGVGTGSTVYYSPDTRAEFDAADGSRQRSEPNTVLAHELIHADNMRKGEREVGQRAINPQYGSNREEEKTIIRENVIRQQMRQPLRGTGSSHNH